MRLVWIAITWSGSIDSSDHVLAETLAFVSGLHEISTRIYTLINYMCATQVRESSCVLDPTSSHTCIWSNSLPSAIAFPNYIAFWACCSHFGRVALKISDRKMWTEKYPTQISNNDGIRLENVNWNRFHQSSLSSTSFQRDWIQRGVQKRTSWR
jgi:hypothetical protein